MDQTKNVPGNFPDKPEIDTVTVGMEITLKNQDYELGDGGAELMNTWLEIWKEMGERPEDYDVTIRKKGDRVGTPDLFTTSAIYQALLAQK